MRLLRRRQPPVTTVPDYPGIRLRISTPSGVVLETDSNQLQSQMARCGHGWNDWTDLIAGGQAGLTEFSTVPLKIEVRALRVSEALE